MNILIVTQYFYPEVFGINEIATELVNRGHNVEVVTGLPNYPYGEVFEGYENKFEEIYNGVKIHRAKVRPRHTGTVNLFKNYCSFMMKAPKCIKKLEGNFDIIFCYMPSPVFQLSAAKFAKKKFNAKLVCMCCDQWPESLKARGIEKGIIFNAVADYSKKRFNECDHIINVAPSFVEYNHNVNGVPYEKMSWSIQHSDDGFAGIDTTKDKNDKTVDLMFAGNIGKVQNVEDIILAYNELKYPDMKIHIFGAGSSYEKCCKLVDEKKLSDNIIFYGRVSKEELLPYYKKMDACLLTLSGKTAIGNTVPSKFTGYLSARKTIIAAIAGDTRKLIDEAECGLCTDPDDYHKLAMIMDEFYKNREKYSSCGINGRSFFEKCCTLDFFVSKLENIFLTLQ